MSTTEDSRKISLPSRCSLLKCIAPVAVWFVANVVSTYYSKKVMVSNNEDNGSVDTNKERGIWKMVHLALWLSFAQLFVSGVIGALFARIHDWRSSSAESVVEETSEPILNNPSIFTFLVEARRRNYSVYKTIIITAVFNAIGSLCVNIAYIHGSVSLVQIIKSLEPKTTYLLSVGLLKMEHSPLVVLSIVNVVAGAAYTSWKDSTHNQISVYVALVSNFMMPLRNVMIKSIEINTNDSRDAEYAASNRTDPKMKLTHYQPSGFMMFSLISVIGSAWIGCVSVLWSMVVATLPIANTTMLKNVIFSSIFFFGYNGASFEVLNLTSPVTHSVLNVLKRFFNIICNIILLHSDFTKDIGRGLSVTFFGLMLFTVSKNKSLYSKLKRYQTKVFIIWLCVVMTAIYHLNKEFQSTNKYLKNMTQSLEDVQGYVENRRLGNGSSRFGNHY